MYLSICFNIVWHGCMGWMYPYLSSLKIISSTILSFIYNFTVFVVDVVVSTPKFMVIGLHWI